MDKEEKKEKVYKIYLSYMLDQVFFKKQNVDKKENKVIDDASKYLTLTCQKNGKANYLDEYGNPISDIWFDKLGEFSNGYAVVCLNGKHNLIDTKGNLVSEKWYSWVWPIQEGFALVEENKKYNYMDIHGNLINDHVWYDSAWYFDNGLAQVKKDKKFNFINTKGVPICDEWYDAIADYHDGYPRVHLNSKHNYINREGKQIFARFIDRPDSFLFSAINKINNNFALSIDDQIACLTIDLNGYQVKKSILGYICTKQNKKFILKYKPIKVYDKRYILCFDERTPAKSFNLVYLYDCETKSYKPLDSVSGIEFKDNLIFNVRYGYAYLIYDGEFINITDYYYDHKNIAEYQFNPGVKIITNKDEVFRKYGKFVYDLKNDSKKEVQSQEKLLKQKETAIQKRKEEEARKTLLRIETLKKLQESIKKLKELEVNEDFVIEKIKIDNIFLDKNGYKIINPSYKDVLYLIDLENVDFTNVKVSGNDFRKCNVFLTRKQIDPSINPQTVYNKDLSNCDFTGVHIEPLTNFAGVDIRGSHFGYDDNILTTDLFNYASFANAIYDDTTTYNGKPLQKAIEEAKKKLGKGK